MKTIEERAKEYAIKRHGKDLEFAPDRMEAIDGYIKGATEQRELEYKQLRKMVLDEHNAIIDNACETYRKELSEIISTFNHLGKRLYDIDELGELISLEGSIDDFRKAMKGE